MTKMILIIYGIICVLEKYKIPILPTLINIIFIRLLLGCKISNGAKIGKNVLLGYGGLGIVIHQDSIIHDNVSIAPHVVLGGTTKKKGAPNIGKNSIIGTGAKILGPVSIGENCYIGANAVVINNIPDNSLAVGLPAKVIKNNIDINDYR